MKQITVILIILAFAISACAKTASHPSKLIAEGEENSFDVKGEVVWEGPKTVVYPIPTTAYRGACGKRRDGMVLRLRRTRVWHRQLLDVAVWMEPVLDEMTPEEIAGLNVKRPERIFGTLEITQKGCGFVPSLAVVPVGTKVDVVNEDRKDHWFVIEGKHKKRQQYVELYGESPSVFTFETPGVHHKPLKAPVEFLTDKVDIWHVSSGFHRWMDAWIFITDKIWFDKVADDGFFEIKSVPRGVYTVHTWHPYLGYNFRQVRVPEDVGSKISISYTLLPEKFGNISSTVEATSKEVVKDHTIWQDNGDEW